MLSRRCPDVAEMADSFGRNAFHVSVISGKENALRCGGAYSAVFVPRSCSTKSTPTATRLCTSNRVHCGLLLLNDRRVDPCVPVPDRNGHTPRSLLEKKWNADEIDTSEVRSTFGISSRSKSP
jgi:hypothetical protein